ncbi:MAG: hypothetical protein ACXVHB_08075 [Solirubrobacteraceae bacterium]
MISANPAVILQFPQGGSLERQLATNPPASVAQGAVLAERGDTDDQGVLVPPDAGEVILSVPSPEALSREPAEVGHVIDRAGTGTEPLVIVIDDAEELREEELAPVVQAAARSSRPVILRVIRDA